MTVLLLDGYCYEPEPVVDVRRAHKSGLGPTEIVTHTFTPEVAPSVSILIAVLAQASTDLVRGISCTSISDQREATYFIYAQRGDWYKSRLECCGAVNVDEETYRENCSRRLVDTLISAHRERIGELRSMLKASGTFLDWRPTTVFKLLEAFPLSKTTRTKSTVATIKRMR